MLYGHKGFVHTTHRQIFHMLYGHKFFVHTTYGNVVYIWYVQVIYICNIDKDVSYYRVQVNNKYIDIKYLRKRYMNISPTGYTI